MNKRHGSTRGRKGKPNRAERRRKVRLYSKHELGRQPKRDAKAKRKKRAAMAKVTRRRNRNHGG